MGPVARSWLASVAVFFSACSLVVDFPDKVPEDAGLDAAPGTRDAAGDVVTADVRPDRSAPEAGPGQTCGKDTDCDTNELCCNVNNAMSCVDTNVQRCTACNAGCDSPRAPNCGQRVCECVPGTGKACDPGQTCDNAGAMPRCVECTGDNDCAMVAGKPFCDNEKCVQCKRGAMADSSSDDVGCGDARTPICGPDRTCIGCDDSLPATKCPGTLVCSPGLGCGGCKADQPIIVANGCAQESSPICKSVDNLTQCVPCTTNVECKFAEGQGYCAGGRCSNKCDGDGQLGANGCTNPAAPFCKLATGVPGGYDCAGCVAADCSNGTYCATAGAKAGACVQCRTNADCPQNGLAPICDQTSFTCRARAMTDCAATPATPILSPTGTCVQCVNDTQCTGGLHCSPTKNTCVQCATFADCPATAPTCNPTTNVCEAGCSELLCMGQAVAKHCNAAMTQCVQCRTSLDCPVSATPLCNAAGACVACTAMPGTTPAVDALCDAKTRGTQCVRTGANTGKCGACGPGTGTLVCPLPQACEPATLLCQ
jgi:hypothetical protein